MKIEKPQSNPIPKVIVLILAALIVAGVYFFISNSREPSLSDSSSIVEFEDRQGL